MAAAAPARMCPAAASTVVAYEVVVPPDIHCSLVVGAATAVVVYVVSIAATSVAGAASVAVAVDYMVAGVVDVGLPRSIP